MTSWKRKKWPFTFTKILDINASWKVNKFFNLLTVDGRVVLILFHSAFSLNLSFFFLISVHFFSDLQRDFSLLTLAFFKIKNGKGKLWSDISALGILRWKHFRKYNNFNRIKIKALFFLREVLHLRSSTMSTSQEEVRTACARASSQQGVLPHAGHKSSTRSTKCLRLEQRSQPRTTWTGATSVTRTGRI